MTPTFSFPRALLTAAMSAALFLAPVAGGTFIAGVAQDTPVAEPTEEQIAAGLIAFKERGGCFNCHGEFGQGGEGGHFPAGPSLRRSQLDPETMHLVISCGLPGTKMPYNLQGAYVTEECYGIVDGEPAEVTPGAALTRQEIDDLVAYIGARQQGQRRITKDQCTEYYGDENAPECAAYR